LSSAHRYLPLWHLVDALLQAANGDLKEAERDLQRAWDIAERGAMALFKGEILLTRARFLRSPSDLIAARQVIERCEYKRREPELLDAERMLRVGEVARLTPWSWRKPLFAERVRARAGVKERVSLATASNRPRRATNPC
jgi:hypothetical protein